MSTTAADVARHDPRPADDAPGVLARLLVLVVRAYRAVLSPLLPPRCRFAPSCSEYAMTALARHGAARGSLLALHRVARCHPFHPGGVDPVPDAAGSGDDVAPGTDDPGRGARGC